MRVSTCSLTIRNRIGSSMQLQQFQFLNKCTEIRSRLKSKELWPLINTSCLAHENKKKKMSKSWPTCGRESSNDESARSKVQDRSKGEVGGSVRGESMVECSRPIPAPTSVVRPRCSLVINRRFRWWPVRVPASGEIKSEDSGGVRYERRHRHQRATHSIMLLTPAASILSGAGANARAAFRWSRRRARRK